MESPLIVLAWNLAAAIGFMTCIWSLSLFLKNASIADIFWGPGFVLVAWIALFSSEGYLGRKLLIVGLISAWGVRLAIHIAFRNWGKGEDQRYQNWRREKGKNFWWISLFTVFGLQGILLWGISLVAQVGQLSPIRTGLPGLTAWAHCFGGWGFFECVSDWQLTRFKADPASKGKVMDQGLWAIQPSSQLFW